MSAPDDDDLLVADGFDEAIVGVAWDDWSTSPTGVVRAARVVYDLDRCVEVLMAQGMDEETAEEYLSFNTVGAYVGPQTPIFMRRQRP
jgi:hypothetical protein